MHALNRRTVEGGTPRAFTLIETLVVVAIVAVLAAIVTTATLGAKRAAKSSSCLSNLKQLELALRLYEGDHDDYWPPHDLVGRNGGLPDIPAFKACLTPYKLDESHWFCPLDEKAGTPYESEFGTHELLSYELCLPFLLQNIMRSKIAKALTRSGIPDPADMWMFADQAEVIETPPRRRVSAHGEKVNVLFADGHVKLMPVFKP